MAFDSVTSFLDPRRTKARSFLQWCEFLGFWNGTFERIDYEVSWISSLNNNIRNMLDSQPFSLQSAERLLKQGKSTFIIYGWKCICERAVEETMECRVKRERDLAKGRRSARLPALNSHGFAVEKIVSTRDWEYAMYEDEEDEEKCEVEEDTSLPQHAEFARNESAKKGRLVFQRAVPRGIGKVHADFPSLGASSDDNSFELVSVSDEEDWEYVDEKLEGMKISDDAPNSSAGDAMGETRSWVAVVQSSNELPCARVPKAPSVSSKAFTMRPGNRQRKCEGRDATEKKDEADEREMYKCSRGGKVRGHKDRHRKRT